MDSAMVYRGMDIGTAKPSAAERDRVKHHLIDILDPAEAYSAGRFVADATEAIENIRKRGNWPLVVGGTMLYLKALQGGLAELPKADAGVRAALDADAERHGWRALHTRLAAVDPVAAARIASTDRQRIQRALEVYELTGQPLTTLQQDKGVNRIDMTAIALVPEDRALLRQRIEQRFDAMLAAGFVAEVENLRARDDLSPANSSIRSVGYRQIWTFLAGGCSLETAREKAIVATRQLAKRQLTWLRSGLAGELLPAGHEATATRISMRVEQIVSERA